MSHVRALVAGSAAALDVDDVNEEVLVAEDRITWTLYSCDGVPLWAETYLGEEPLELLRGVDISVL